MIKNLLLVLALLLLPGVAEAVDRYVSTTGATTNCTTMQNSATPASSFAAALVCLSAGDTLYVRGGTYTERIKIYELAMNAGTSFTNAITISGYPGETAILKPSVHENTPALHYSDSVVKDWYHIWQNLTFDGTDTDTGGIIAAVNHNTRFVRFNDNEVRNAGGGTTSGQGFSWFGDNSEFLRNNVHHNGTFNDIVFNTACGYGFYVGGVGNVTEANQIHHNGGYGYHGFSTGGGVNNNIVRFNTVWDNGQCTGGPGQETSAILMSSGTGHVIHNNLVYMTGPSPAAGAKGISMQGTGVIYNNTVYHFNYPGISVGNAANAIVQNNIVYDTDTSGAFGTQLELWGTTTGQTVDHNLLTNPLFVSSGTGDFRLQAGSGAVNTGVTLGAPYNRDIVATSRPQGAAYDIGAYELASAATCPSLPNALVAQYRFEGVATDSSGNGLTASLGAGVTYTTGKYGQGALMPGTAGITVNDNDLLDLCASFALEAWVSVPSVAADAMFVVKNPDSKFFLGMLAGYCDVGVVPVGGYSQGSGFISCAAPPLVTEVFTHLAVSYDGTTISLYKNAALVATLAGGATLDATTGTLQFCTSGFNEHCPAGTIIDEVKIYRGPRTAPQIAADMMDGSTPAQVVLKIPSGATGLKLGGSGVKLGTQTQ